MKEFYVTRLYPASVISKNFTPKCVPHMILKRRLKPSGKNSKQEETIFFFCLTRDVRVDVVDEARLAALTITELLNSKECTKKLRGAFLDSLRNPKEKGREEPVRSSKLMRNLDRQLYWWSLASGTLCD